MKNGNPEKLATQGRQDEDNTLFEISFRSQCPFVSHLRNLYEGEV